jgi:dTDP-4-amino-4,6-dideoxygalactose transaminase
MRSASLVVLGGDPAFPEKLHVGRPNLGDRARLLERINGVLDRRWLSNNGACVQEFEQRIAEFCGVRHCIAVSNGMVGLEVVIRALDLKGEVIVPAFTFVATAHALQWQQVTPVFADVDPRTHNLDPRSVERMITPRTTGIIGVHLWGQPCEHEELQRVVDQHGLKLVYDAAHAFGCAVGGRKVGSFGAAEVFSFHATKFVNSLEGGAIVTNDDALARRCRLMTNFGFLGFDQVGYVGTNGKMDEFSAAMGLTSMESMADFVAVNRANHAIYQRELAGLPGISPLAYATPGVDYNHQYVVAEVDEVECPLSRDLILDVLWAENVLARRYFYPGVHRMEPYRTLFPEAWRGVPQAERIARRVLILPTGQCVDAVAITKVCSLVRAAVANAPEVRRSVVGSAFQVHRELI